MAASGIGASDIVAATVGGATYGLALLWALLLGAFFKFVLSEGLARWQLATRSTALEGWAHQLPRWVMVLKNSVPMPCHASQSAADETVTNGSVVTHLSCTARPKHSGGEGETSVSQASTGTPRQLGGGVLGAGLEPARLAPYAPQTYVSANSTTRAFFTAAEHLAGEGPRARKVFKRGRRSGSPICRPPLVPYAAIAAERGNF